MQYTMFSGTDLRVSRVCLGTAFRSERGEADCAAVIDAAAETGCNFIDTANIYRDGLSERIVGRTLEKRRDEFIIASKVGSAMPSDNNPGGLSRTGILRSVEQSLKRLNTDRIDLYICHCPDENTSVEETADGMDALDRQRKLRYNGLSSYESWRMENVLRCCASEHLTRPVCNQVKYNLIDRGIERGLVKACKAGEVAVTVFAPTAIGLLAGLYQYGKPPPAGTPWHQGPYNFRAAMTPRVRDVIQTLLDLSGETGHSPSQLAVAWCLHHEVDSVIIGADTPEHAREDMAAGAIMMSEEILERLDDVSEGLRTSIRKDSPGGYERGE